MSKADRPHMPLSIKLEAALRQLGFDPADVEYDHHPALGLRERLPNGRYSPDANDPRYIVIRSRSEHRLKTSGGKATSYGSDIHAIAKIKRLSKDQEELRRIMLKPAGHKRQTKSRWGTRKLSWIKKRK
jgi:hypothetical protein